MSSFLLGSYIALWIVAALQTIALAALARQIALLHSRLPGFGAMMTNPGQEVGLPVKPFVADDVHGKTIHIPDPEKPKTLLVFLSEGCSNCEELEPALRATARQESKGLKVILMAFNGDARSNRAYSEKRGLAHLPLVSSSECAQHFQVFITPYALLLDAKGVILSKGLVNRREHLDSLLNAGDAGHSNLQDLMKSKGVNGSNDAGDANQSITELTTQKG
jgi:methylamine dehydrogenase accessory protein MauD